jgi:hypothetical protein
MVVRRSLNHADKFYFQYSARVPLPENWDKVMLDKKAIVKLASFGIKVEQEPVRNVRRHAPPEATQETVAEEA